MFWEVGEKIILKLLRDGKEFTCKLPFIRFGFHFPIGL